MFVRRISEKLGISRRPRLRGSALTFVLIVVSATSIAVVALVGFAGQSYRRQVSAEYKLGTQYAFEGAIAQLRSEITRGMITPPLNKNITLGGITTAVSVTDNSASKANTYRVDATTTAKGKNYARTFIIGSGPPDSLFNYAVGFLTAETFSRAVTTSNQGSVYVAGNLTVSVAGCSAAGNLKAAGDIAGAQTMSVTGSTYEFASAIPTPSVVASNYQSAADMYYSSSTSFSGGTSPDYFLIYVNGNVTINAGTYTGKAILFCTGSVTITGNMTYGNSSSQIVVISQGGLTASAASPISAVGTYYIGGALTVTQTLNITRGSIIANSVSFSNPLSCAFDPYFKNNPSEMQAMKLPGACP